MRMSSSSWIPMLVGLVALGGCEPKEEEPEPVDTDDGSEPAYTVVDGVPPSSGEWEGKLQYTRTHPYAWDGKGPVLEVERLTASASFFEGASWGLFDLMETEGCWTDSWTPGWTGFLDVGESLAVQVGAEAVTFTPATTDDGTLYTWVGENPAEPWSVEAGALLGLDGVETSVIIPERLNIIGLAGTWVAYAETGLLEMEWDPPTMGESWIHLLRREEDSRYTRCHIRDDGEVSIQFNEMDWDDARLTISRISSAEVDLPTFGRTMVFSEEVVLLDP